MRIKSKQTHLFASHYPNFFKDFSIEKAWDQRNALVGFFIAQYNHLSILNISLESSKYFMSILIEIECLRCREDTSSQW